MSIFLLQISYQSFTQVYCFHISIFTHKDLKFLYHLRFLHFSKTNNDHFSVFTTLARTKTVTQCFTNFLLTPSITQSYVKHCKKSPISLKMSAFPWPQLILVYLFSIESLVTFFCITANFMEYWLTISFKFMHLTVESIECCIPNLFVKNSVIVFVNWELQILLISKPLYYALSSW